MVRREKTGGDSGADFMRKRCRRQDAYFRMCFDFGCGGVRVALLVPTCAVRTLITVRAHDMPVAEVTRRSVGLRPTGSGVRGGAQVRKVEIIKMRLERPCRLPWLRVARLCCEDVSVVVVRPPVSHPMTIGEMMRSIKTRDFCPVARRT
jgi:hypothetical protein